MELYKSGYILYITIPHHYHDDNEIIISNYCYDYAELELLLLIIEIHRVRECYICEH
jgi:hypothetical protein